MQKKGKVSDDPLSFASTKRTKRIKRPKRPKRIKPNSTVQNPRLNTECPICLDGFDEKNNYTVYSCSHAMHDECSKGLLTGNCPICRTTIIKTKPIKNLNDDYEESLMLAQDMQDEEYFEYLLWILTSQNIQNVQNIQVLGVW